ncbi:MAG: hypothetical protein ABIM76_07280 [candidate division WOR-3 bacterium]
MFKRRDGMGFKPYVIIVLSLVVGQVSKIPVRGSTPYIPSPGSVIESLPTGNIDWTNKVIRAKGQGVIDTVNFPNKAQAKLIARRAAIAIAQRNLLETIKGVRITSETKVQDMMVKSDYVYTRIDGVIKGAREVGEPVEKNGIIEVELEIPLYDSIAPIVQPKPITVSPQVLSESEKKLVETYSAFIIDATKTDAKPGLFPRIVDEKGNVIFDFSEYYDSKNPKFKEVIKYVGSVEELLNDPVIRSNPFVIKVKRANSSDLVVDEEASKKVNWLKKSFNFLLKTGKLLILLL